MVKIYIILSTIVNVLHTFQKAKSYLFNGNFAFSSIQTVHAFIIIHFMSALQHPLEFVS